MLKIVEYIKARLNEKTTWAGVVAAVTAGAALEIPYSWLVIAAGVIAVVVPS